MSTDLQGGANTSNSAKRAAVSPGSLWFGTITTFIAWSAAGCLDVMVVWAVSHQEEYGVPPDHPVARTIFGLLAVALLILSIYSGIVSLRNWKKLSGQQTFLEAQGVERREYMASLGVIMTLTLGMGIFWLALPALFLDLCWRVR